MGVSENVSGTLRAQKHGHQPSVYCLQGNGIDRADTAGCNGKGWREDVSYTLNTIDRPAVMIENQPIVAGFKAGQSKAGGLGYEIEKASTLSATASGLEPTVLIIDQGAGKSSVSLSENVSPTLATTHDGAPAVYDARGNGDGKTVCTITGDHQNRVTDYTAIVSTYSSEAYDKWKQNEVGSSLRASGGMYQGGGESLICTAVDCRNGTENENVNVTLQAKANGGQSLNCGIVIREKK